LNCDDIKGAAFGGTVTSPKKISSVTSSH